MLFHSSFLFGTELEVCAGVSHMFSSPQSWKSQFAFCFKK